MAIKLDPNPARPLTDRSAIEDELRRLGRGVGV